MRVNPGQTGPPGEKGGGKREPPAVHAHCAASARPGDGWQMTTEDQFGSRQEHPLVAETWREPSWGGDRHTWGCTPAHARGQRRDSGPFRRATRATLLFKHLLGPAEPLYFMKRFLGRCTG